MGFRRCPAPNCSNSSKWNSGLSFTVPKDEKRGKRWIINMRQDDLLEKPINYCHRNILVCAHHFEDTQFMNVKNNTLTHDAVPTLFAVSNPPRCVTPRRNLSGEQVEDQAKKKKEENDRNQSCRDLGLHQGTEVYVSGEERKN